MLQMPWKQLDGQRVMNVKVGVGIGVVVGGRADVVSGCDSDHESENCDMDSVKEMESSSVGDGWLIESVKVRESVAIIV